MRARGFQMASLMVAMTTILAAGCSSRGGDAPASAAAPAPEEANITVAAIPAVDLAGLYIAQDRGLFARQGLHVTIEPIPSSQTAAIALPATYPVGPVIQANIQRVATAMLKFGVLGQQYATEVTQGTLVGAMVSGY